MQMDEQLIALVTQKVLEALGQNAPAANEAETPEGAVKGIQGPAMLLSEKEEAKPGSTPDEVVIGIAPGVRSVPEGNDLRPFPCGCSAGDHRGH